MTAPMKTRTLATAGYVDPTKLPRGPNGRALCRYCGTEVPQGRFTFCSGQAARFARRTGELLAEGQGCVHQHLLRSRPDYARLHVWLRDRGKCALCGVQSPTRGARHWQADHTVPVSEGGGSCGLDNLRTLCTGCHRHETAKLAARRAQARRKPGFPHPAA